MSPLMVETNSWLLLLSEKFCMNSVHAFTVIPGRVATAIAVVASYWMLEVSIADKGGNSTKLFIIMTDRTSCKKNIKNMPGLYFYEVDDDYHKRLIRGWTYSSEVTVW